MIREVKLVGVPMKANETEFKVPVMPGWKMVAATRGTFGAQIIFERERPATERAQGEGKC